MALSCFESLKSFRPHALAAAAAIALFAFGSQPVHAQQEGTQTTGVNEEITIVAPRVVKRKIVGRTPIGAPIEVVTLSRPVSYGDLDLATEEGRATLRKRIEDTAKKTCKELDVMYPESMYPPIPAEQHCVENAISEAMAVQALVSNASAQK